VATSRATDVDDKLDWRKAGTFLHENPRSPNEREFGIYDREWGRGGVG